MKKINRKLKLEAVVLSLILIGTMLFVPTSALKIEKNIDEQFNEVSLIKDKSFDEDFVDHGEQLPPFQLDRNYVIDSPEETAVTIDSEENYDVGTKRDAGDSMRRATMIYPGEPVDYTPGRGDSAIISSVTDDDWYRFSACEGQNIQISISGSGGDLDIELWDINEEILASSESEESSSESFSYTAEYTGYYYLHIKPIDIPEDLEYLININMNNQNDIGSGSDAGNSQSSAMPITPGSYSGYLDANDEQDWYSFDVNAGEGIHFNLEMSRTAILSDFDITLYNPSGEEVHEEDYYYDDELWYPADQSGTWTVKIDIFPGFSNIPYEDEDWKYYSYGSGAYELIFAIESDAPEPLDPIPQPDITPVSKTFIIQNDPTSTKDEYAYLAAVPASNYLSNNQRYLAPILYEGDSTPTNYFNTDGDRGTVDTTTEYLKEDWNTYLASHGKTAIEIDVSNDPINAAAEIAKQKWTSSDRAVIAIDGSDYEDTVETVIDESKNMKRTVDVTVLSSDNSKLQSSLGNTMFIGKEWGAITLDVPEVTKPWGDDACTLLTNLFPNYMPQGSDWWPTPYDGAGSADDLFLPITQPGIWGVDTDLSSDDFSEYIITKIAGERYSINVDGDAKLKVTVETDEPSDLLVFLVDPDGNLRAPDIPQWNGPVLPIHEWYGFENPEDNPWREWNPEPHTEFTAEVLHPETGSWTAIVVPRYAEGDDINYNIVGEFITINKKRSDASISASNAAVIASQENVPLLFVKEDSIPSETSQALSDLGVSKVIFVERGEIGSQVKSNLPTLEADLTTMQDIIDYIKAYDHSENYITITSIKSDEGYFASASMLAAYHCSPVLRIGEAPGNPAGVADRIETWRLWDGDYYHGSRATGHLPDAKEPLPGEGSWTLSSLVNAALYAISGGSSGDIPPIGMDAKRYWNEELHDGIYNWIADYGLDLEGQEGYVFVAPRKDIYLEAHSVMLGNRSYAGHIPGETPAYISALINRNILYPALIFANPNRDITTSQFMNFPDGGMWTTNDGETHNVYSSRLLKKVFGSHFREFEGHCLWDAHLKRMNDGASLMYYSGHGTGGSGISAQYIQTEHCNYPEQIWWDAWRGYSGFDNWKIARNNGRSWYNADPPSLYDIIHYDHVDRLTENLRSCAVFYMSCTTGDAFGPMVYLDHGAVVWYGNSGSGLCPEADLQDDEFFQDVLLDGEMIGPAYSKQVWLHYRDFTTSDPTAMYGSSSVGGYSITTVQVIYGDPNLIVYSPEWSSPIPIDA